MDRPTLLSLSPIDGRYAGSVADLQEYFSEYALFRYRLLVEVRWLEFICDRVATSNVAKISQHAKSQLELILTEFSPKHAERIKEIEKVTNHDVKAVEYYLREQLVNSLELEQLQPWVHFACTSEDINNLAYSLMLQESRAKIVIPLLEELNSLLRVMAHRNAALPMLSRTHGQPASPTTMGKEIANFVVRLERQIQQLSEIDLLGKINGAVGNYNAHVVAFPELDWIALSAEFVRNLGLTPNPLTTQIEPHDCFADFFNGLSRINTVLIDLSRDIWSYISINYFTQQTVAQEVGSSTMPHKVNPIDFENAEGNLGVANALANFFAAKLPISRWQRDLSDSTVLRNIGVSIAHSVISYRSLKKGLLKLQVNTSEIERDLEANPEVLAEAVQTVMRCYQVPNAYERLKALTRGKKLSIADLRQFVQDLEIPEEAKKTLLELVPRTYIGRAVELAQMC